MQVPAGYSEFFFNSYNIMKVKLYHFFLLLLFFLFYFYFFFGVDVYHGSNYCHVKQVCYSWSVTL